MKTSFGPLPGGREASLYTISRGGITAALSDLGATLVRLFVPDREGKQADIVLGYDDAMGYWNGRSFFGAIVGRNANRVGGASFPLGGREYRLQDNENGNNLHSGWDYYHLRLWDVAEAAEDRIVFHLYSPNGDQGFPGNADIRVTYHLSADSTLHITYDGICDRDTVFNMTNHSYFNLAGEDQPRLAYQQELTLPARFFTACDSASIPTENRDVDGTPMDFRVPKPISRDAGRDYDALKLQGGYDHNFEVFCNPCATLYDPTSGRAMAVCTDLPGVQFYAGNFVDEIGKNGIHYAAHSGVCLETQYYPDALHHPGWPQPVTKAGVPYHTETHFRFFTK